MALLERDLCDDKCCTNLYKEKQKKQQSDACKFSISLDNKGNFMNCSVLNSCNRLRQVT